MAASSQTRRFKIALVQMACGEDVAANLEKAERRIEEAVAAGARLVCLQELFASVYFCQNLNHAYFGLAESVPGPLTERFGALAKRLGVVLLVPVYEKRAPGLYFNSCAVIDADGAFLGVYRKMHIPHDPQFEEKFYFAPGDLGFRAWDTAVGRIGVLICWDQWYPEAARLTALHGAEILFYPTAIGWFATNHAATSLSTASGSSNRGKSSNGATRWPTAVMWRRRTAAGAKRPTGVRGLSFGAGVLWPTPAGRWWRGRRWSGKRSWWWRSTLIWCGSSGRCGRFCAIGAWMPTGTSINAFWANKFNNIIEQCLKRHFRSRAGGCRRSGSRTRRPG